MTVGHLVIKLPSDRKLPGKLMLFSPAAGPADKPIFSCSCLGRSAGHANNPTRDPLKYRGHTPLGEYAVTFVTTLARPITGIGSLWVGLDPIGGQAQKAEDAGRTGLGIHGGRGDEVFKMTHGCIRLLDRDMAALAKAAAKLRFDVSIVQA
ncbi:L,D-transpeptidase [Sphingomonas sp. SRS2]|uniref:L,D-transpeptidase n=1 Tax=Sphingomonas sp. SRS2 TaxID=133190 RepID=UPI000698B52B|nr:L,D-transpeptidase [Sphingomonas sp. SRS2]